MAKRIMMVLLALCVFSIPVSGLAHAAASVECGDGSVPPGTWPNCEPCAGGAALAEMGDILKEHKEVLDANLDPSVYDYVRDCLAGLEKVFFWNVELPSIEDILGMLCDAARDYSEQMMADIDRRIGISAPYGLGGVSGGMSGGSGTLGDITVVDTSRQAVDAVLLNF